jgi:hypothetical protein
MCVFPIMFMFMFMFIPIPIPGIPMFPIPAIPIPIPPGIIMSIPGMFIIPVMSMPGIPIMPAMPAIADTGGGPAGRGGGPDGAEGEGSGSIPDESSRFPSASPPISISCVSSPGAGNPGAPPPPRGASPRVSGNNAAPPLSFKVSLSVRKPIILANSSSAATSSEDSPVGATNTPFAL